MCCMCYPIHCINYWVRGDSNWIHYVLTPLKNIVLTGSAPGNAPLWFLTALFLVRIFMRTAKGVKWYICGSIIGVSISYACSYYDIGIRFLPHVGLGFACAGVGYLMKNQQFDKRVLIAAIVLYTIPLFRNDHIDMNMNMYGDGVWYFLNFSSTIAGCIVINNIFRCLNRPIPILECLGRNSMGYYILHYPLVSLIQVFCIKILGLNGGVITFSIMLLACCLILPLLNNAILNSRYKWILGA